MNYEHLKTKFTDIGARVVFGALLPRPWQPDENLTLSVDIRRDNKGQFFEFLVAPGADVEIDVLQATRRERHLLLLIRETTAGGSQVDRRYLCGHDERAWFAAAVPRASTVRDALEALKPPIIQESQARLRLKTKHRNKRRNAAFVRQGEWFFVPCPDLYPHPLMVLRKEPLLGGGRKPHIADLLYRRGGTSVRVSAEYPNGLTSAEYKKLIVEHPEKKKVRWRTMQRDPEAFVKGRIRHPDHKTVVLPFWHRVVPNTEFRSASAAGLAFLD